MPSSNLARFSALLFGALIVGNSLSNLPSRITPFEDDISALIIVISSAPVFFSILIAWLLFRYAKRVELQLEHSNEQRFLFAGLKLLGFYLLSFGIPTLFTSAVFLITEPDERFWMYSELLFSSTLDIVIGYLLIWHTTRVMRLGDSKPDV